MCADKDGVENTWHDAYTKQAHACKPDRPRGDDRCSGKVPRGEIAADTTKGRGKIEQVDWAARGGEASRRVGHEKQ
jgi:hypothetical protein